MRGHDANEAPSPPQLAAYFDGELDPVVRARVAAWLTDHPDVAADLEAQRSAREAAQAAPPPEPCEAAWSAVLDRIDERTQIIRAKQRRDRLRFWRRRAFWLRAGAGTGVAAAVLIALLLRQPLKDAKAPNTQVQPPAPPMVVAHVLPVADDEEVEIISMDAADAPAVVVGRLPMPKKFELAATGEVVVHEVVGPNGTKGMIPNKVNMDDSPGVPMLDATLAVVHK
jgi:anti-sigma factor RsiW